MRCKTRMEMKSKSKKEKKSFLERKMFGGALASIGLWTSEEILTTHFCGAYDQRAII